MAGLQGSLDHVVNGLFQRQRMPSAKSLEHLAHRDPLAAGLLMQALQDRRFADASTAGHANDWKERQNLLELIESLLLRRAKLNRHSCFPISLTRSNAE